MSVRTKILQKGKIVQEQLIRTLIKFDERITTLEQGETGELVDIGALKETVGDSSSGLVKSVADINTAIGTSTSGSETGFYKDIADINTAIGDESTKGTILARIKALENAQTPAQTPEEPSG